MCVPGAMYKIASDNNVSNSKKKQTWNQYKGPFIRRWANKLCDSHTLEYKTVVEINSVSGRISET